MFGLYELMLFMTAWLLAGTAAWGLLVVRGFHFEIVDSPEPTS